MAPTKSKPEPTSLTPAPVAINGPPSEVLSLTEAAAYLRLTEQEVVRLVREQELPGRPVVTQWRFLKAAIQAWLSQPGARPDFWEACAGLFKDDPDLQEIVKEAYRRRGRPVTKDE